MKMIQTKLNLIQKGSLGLLNQTTTRIDLSKLRFGTLRKYQCYFGITTVDQTPSIQTLKETLPAIINHHFSQQLKVSPRKLVYRYLSLPPKEIIDGTSYKIRDRQIMKRYNPRKRNRNKKEVQGFTFVF